MIAIVGAGAMGGILAARLVNAGYPVTLVDVSEAVVSAINTNGLIVDVKNSGVETVTVRATQDPQEVGIVDFVIFFVKAQHTASAAALAKPMIGPDTAVVSLQNGWGNADVLSEVFSKEQIVVGVTYHSATIAGPGRVAHTGFGATFIGPYADNGSLTKAEQLGEILALSGFENTVTAKVKTEIWKKLILNTATLPTGALTGLCAGDTYGHKPLLELVDAIALESVAVARASGYDIDAEERLERIHQILSGAGKGKASMLQDAEGRRKTEIEVINAAVVRAAEKLGIEVPLNKAMVSLISGMEEGWKK